MDLQDLAPRVFVLLHVITGVLAAVDGQSPNFDVPVVNVTAISGTTAILPCTINYVGNHKVMWMDPRKKVMTMGDVRIISDMRISLERPYTRDWNLHVRDVKLNDSGEYQCQINTKPVKSKKIVLHVNESPRILEHAGNQIVREGETVSLWCRVTGVPYPRVTWYRSYVHDKHTAKEVIGVDGEELKIHNISRYCEDVYECVAYNGIEPADSRQMKVTVEFPPEVQLYTNRMSQYAGKETILDCRITANPHGYNVWRKGGKEITNSWKYGVNVYEEDRYVKTLSLRIGSIDENDYGKYKCFAQNKFGNDEEVIVLFEARTTTSTTTPTTSQKSWLVETKPIDGGNIYLNQNNGRTGSNKQPNRYQPSWDPNETSKAGKTAAAATGSGAGRVRRGYDVISACAITLLILQVVTR